MPLVMTFVAESHQIVPYEPQGWVLSDWHDVVDLSAGSGSAFLVAVLTQWIQFAVPCRQLVPRMVVVSTLATLTLVACSSAVVVSLWADLLHVFVLL